MTIPRPPERGLPVTDLLNPEQQQVFLDELFEAIPCMVFVKRASDLAYIRLNGQARTALGLSDADVLGKTDLDVFPADDAVRIQVDDRLVLTAGSMGEVFEEQLLTADGLRWFGTQKVPIAAADGRSDLLFTFSEDITAQKQLLSTAAQWDQVFHHSQRGMVVGDPDGTTLELMNPAFAEMLGYTIEELTGTPILDIFSPEVRSEVEAMFGIVRLNGQHAFESACLRKDGETFPVQVDATSMEDAEGNVHHRAIRIQDTTLLKSNERMLRADRTEAERANEAKSEFLARMSHELRTPLNVILGFAQVVQLDELNVLQSESIGHILQAGRHLLALIDETLDISRLESGRIALTLEQLDIEDAVKEVLGLMQPLANAGDVRLVNESTGDACLSVADRHRLKQVLLNLVANGINYNVRGGEVRVRCETVGESARISVSDSGIGIPKGGFDRLFAPFDRLGREESEIEGTGLGLSLSKALVEAMGGTIAAARIPKGGSVFTVTLPKVSGNAVASLDIGASRGTISSAERLILCIESDVATLRLVEQVLGRRPGLEMLPAMQGSIGLQLARHHQPDIIILDVHLSDISGEETLRRLASDPKTRSIPVILIGADAAPLHARRILDLRARAYLTKPIDVRHLLETVDAIVAENDAQLLDPS